MKLNMIDIFNEGIIFTKMKSAAQLRSELDACCARLYTLTSDELRYTLRVDPKEVHGEDFPGETFLVLKEKEVRLCGEYRTSRLVLEAWDGRMNYD